MKLFEHREALTWLCLLNPLTPVSDQDRISPYYVYTISCRQVVRIKKIYQFGDN